MATVVAEDSPLAAYLEGRGEAQFESHPIIEQSHTRIPLLSSFAPRGRPIINLGSHRLDLRPALNTRWVTKIRQAYASAFNLSLGKQDNDRFLEHFRYIIIASQLLDESSSTGSSGQFQASASPRDAASSSTLSGSFTGALASTAAAFTLVWLVDWARGGSSGSCSLFRIFLASFTVTVAFGILYMYLRREWLQRLRRQAIITGSALVTNIQTFEATASSMLTLIQEVELVSRGYRISSPLPPISRIEGDGQQRRCSRIRRTLDSSLAKTIPALLIVADVLRELVNDDDLERYYEVYDVRSEDLEDAFLGYTNLDSDDNETVKHLRIHQYRFCTLRRVVFCSLLALPATSRREDFARWQIVVNNMDQLRLIVGETGQKMVELINEDDRITPQSPSKSRISSSHRRAQLQVRKISTLSTGIRSLQAKILLLREESNRSLSTTDSESDISELGASLMDQYESIGSDLKALMHEWETGKSALAMNIDWHERRLSRASGGPRSPIPSFCGLSVVDERSGSPSQALKLLTGGVPLSPPSTENGDVSPSEDDEVFEAVALPRQRSTLTREQRIIKMHEDRERQTTLQEKRDSNTILIKELESVIKLRPSRLVNARTTSV